MTEDDTFRFLTRPSLAELDAILSTVEGHLIDSTILANGWTIDEWLNAVEECGVRLWSNERYEYD
jgi:hypothetical protein